MKNDCTNLVEMTVETIVDDRVKVLQAAPVKCIEDVSACPCLLKPGVHLITVLQLKQEVWCRRRCPIIFRQVTKIGVLVEIKQTHRKQKPICKRHCGSCIYTQWCTSSFCSVFTAKLFEERIQCVRARWWSPSLGRSLTNSLTPGKDFTSAN